MCNHSAIAKLRRHVRIVTRSSTAQPLNLKHRKARAVPVTLTPCPLPASSFRAAEELAQLDKPLVSGGVLHTVVTGLQFFRGLLGLRVQSFGD